MHGGPEITNLTAKLQVVIPIGAITSRAPQALGRLFATRLKQRLRVGFLPFAGTRSGDELAPIPAIRRTS
jgi:hypothetical protein